MQADTMVVLKEYNTLTEAEMAKSILDSEGMWSMIHSEYMATILPTGGMPARLIVRDEDLDRANEMIDAMDKTAQTDPEEE